MWHPTVAEDQKSSRMPSPRYVQLWIDRGQRLANRSNRGGNNGLIEPQIVWRDSYQPDHQYGASERRNKSVSSMTKRPRSIALLSICRVIEIDRSKKGIDRSKYPLARQSCSFLLRTCDKEEFVFEARTKAERDTVTRRLKMVISRLASLAITDNDTARRGSSSGRVRRPATLTVPGPSCRTCLFINLKNVVTIMSCSKRVKIIIVFQGRHCLRHRVCELYAAHRALKLCSQNCTLPPFDR